jgi:uncharacterized membrane protein YoaK (UPF0700 family)
MKTEHVLLLLTVVAGAVDAVSYLALDHVFVVNMTGNIVFLGFAAAGSTSVSLAATAIALGAFLAGSVAGGRLSGRRAADTARLLRLASAIKVALVVAALLVVVIWPLPLESTRRDVVIALLAFAMGLQNAAARSVGIPDLTTTVLTMTLTAFAAESRLGGGASPRAGWRIASVLAMLVGAFAGALCVLRGGIAAALALTVVLLVLTTLGTNQLAAAVAAEDLP